MHGHILSCLLGMLSQHGIQAADLLKLMVTFNNILEHMCTFVLLNPNSELEQVSCLNEMRISIVQAPCCNKPFTDL